MSLVLDCVKRFHSNKSNFSIDHILNVAGNKHILETFQSSEKVLTEDKPFDWLNCTRYKPPKLPRQRKKSGTTRRKMGRNPRIPFSSSQVAFLEAKFLRTPYLSSSDVTQLANYLKLSETRVKIWFQNRRARERRENYSRSKTDENSPKNAAKCKPSPRQETILPLEFPECFPLNDSGTFRYATCSRTDSDFRMIAPLDLSERQLDYRSNNF